MWTCSNCGSIITLSGFGEMKSDKCPKCGVTLDNLHNKHEYSKWLNYAFFQFWCFALLAWLVVKRTQLPEAIAYVLVFFAVGPYVVSLFWSLLPEIASLDNLFEKLVSLLVLPARSVGRLIGFIWRMFLGLIRK
jgi:hypothetical protein